MFRIKDMFGINDVINYIRSLRYKEELDRLIVKHILISKPKCIACGFEYTAIEDIYEKLPIISLTMGRKKHNLVCNGCREEAINKLFKTNDKNMKKNNKILFYLRKDENGCYSNFERADQIIDNITYASNEHWYQSQKAKHKQIRNWIIYAPNPFLAMKGGRSLRKKETKENWDNIKVVIMLRGLRAKFNQNEYLKKKLLATGNATLHEDSPTDMFWGIKGKDMLGKLLMKVREELRNK